MRLLCLILVFWACSAAAADPLPKSSNYPIPGNAIFVSPSGNDSTGDGSIGKPFATVARSVDRVTRGTPRTIVLRGGAYRGTAVDIGIPLGLTVTFQSYPGEVPVLLGTVAIPSNQWTADGPRWRKDNWTAWSSVLFADCNSAIQTNPNSGPKQVFLDDGGNWTRLVPVGSVAAVGPGQFYADVPNNRIYIGDNPNLSGRVVEVTNVHRAIRADYSSPDSAIKGLVFKGYGSHCDASIGKGIVTGNATPRLTIENNVFAYSGYRAVELYGGLQFNNEFVVKGNSFVHNGGGGIGGYGAHGTTIEDNYFSSNNAQHFSYRGAAGDAGNKFASTVNLTVKKNLFDGELSNSFWCDTSCADFNFLQNTVRNSEQSGVFLEASPGPAIIAGNLIHGNPGAGVVINAGNVRVYNNTVIKNGYAEIDSSNSSGVSVVNNIFGGVLDLGLGKVGELVGPMTLQTNVTDDKATIDSVFPGGTALPADIAALLGVPPSPVNIGYVLSALVPPGTLEARVAELEKQMAAAMGRLDKLEGVGVAMANYFVSPNGSDSAAGTIDAPFRTLDKARQVVRTVNAAMAEDITVFFRGGRYPFTDAVAFDEDDSGFNGFKVKYRGYPGEIARFSGGVAVTGWADQDGGIWKANTGALRMRQLYVDGARAQRARTPDAGTFYNIQGWDKPAETVLIDTADIAAWARPTQVEMIVQVAWTTTRARIASFADLGGGTTEVTFAEPDRSNIFEVLPAILTNDQAFHFENALEFLTEEGEWYQDNTNGDVYYKPFAGENMATVEVIAPSIERLITLEGSSLDAPIHDLEFRGIRFEHSTWTWPSDNGLAQWSPGRFGSATVNELIPSAIYVTNADRIRFERDVFWHLGGSGIMFFAGVHDSFVVGNVIRDISADGLFIGGELVQNPADARSIVKNNTVANNWMTEPCRDYSQCASLVGGYVQDNLVEHNEISFSPYSGIMWGFGSTYDDTALRDNIWRYNDIHHVMQLLADGGGFYHVSKDTDSLVFENWIHDISKSPTLLPAAIPPAAIYFDEGSSFITAQRNVISAMGAGTNGVYANTEGPYTDTDNDISDQSVKDNAGLTAAYSDIKLMGGAPSMTISPTDIAGIQLWLKADQITGNDGDAVATWADQSGNLRDVDNGTAGERPLLKKAANGINNQNVVRFDGADDNLFRANTNIIQNVAETTVFLVIKLANTTQDSTAPLFISHASGGSTRLAFFMGLSADAKFHVGGRRLDADSNVQLTGGDLTTDVKLLTATFDYVGTDVILYEEGVETASNLSWQTTGNTQDSASAEMVIGANSQAGVGGLAGDVAEVIIYDTVLSELDRQRVEWYLAEKYAIAGPEDPDELGGGGGSSSIIDRGRRGRR